MDVPVVPEELEPSKCVKMADALEDVLLEQLNERDKDGKSTCTAAMAQVARSYLKDQGFVAAKRPNANLTPIQSAVEERAALEVPFPVDDAATDGNSA